MANSLPRSWTKAKKRNAAFTKNNNAANAKSENINDISEIVAADAKFLQNFDNNLNYENKCVCVKEIAIAPRSSIIPRRNRALSAYNSLPKTNPYAVAARESSDHGSSDEDRSEGGTGPKTRSRIKTNPWLPSPKIAPANQNPCSNFNQNNSNLSSPVSSRSRSSSIDRSFGSRSLNNSRSLNHSRSSSIYSRSRSLESPSRDNDDDERLGFFTSCKFEDDCASGSGKLSSGIGLASDGEGTSISSIESDGFIFYESLDDLRASPDDKGRKVKEEFIKEDTFLYEDHFESMVENVDHLGSLAKLSCTSLDLLHTDAADPSYVKSVTMVAEVTKQEAETLHQDEVDDGIGHSDEENEHVCNVYDKRILFCKSGQTDSPSVTAASSDSEDEYNIEDAESDACLLNCYYAREYIEDMEKSTVVEAKDANEEKVDEQIVIVDDDEQPKASSTPKVEKRSIEQIKASLEEKVHQLKRDKYIVEEKIREAQEEERIRMKEKLRYQKQITLHRKQLLVRTLSDLRVRLESQCQRLQNSYSAVLQMQKDNPHVTLNENE